MTSCDVASTCLSISPWLKGQQRQAERMNKTVQKAILHSTTMSPMASLGSESLGSALIAKSDLSADLSPTYPGGGGRV